MIPTAEFILVSQTYPCKLGVIIQRTRDAAEAQQDFDFPAR